MSWFSERLNAIGDWFGDLFKGETIQTVTVSSQPFLPIDSKQKQPILILNQQAHIKNTSISQEIKDELLHGKMLKLKQTFKYIENKSLDGLPKFFVAGEATSYNDALFNELLNHASIAGSEQEDVTIKWYSDTLTPSMQCLTYYYMENNGYSIGDNGIVHITEVIDNNYFDEPNLTVTIPDNNCSNGSGNRSIVNLNLKIQDIVQMTKVLDNGTECPIFGLQLRDEATNDIYYHDVRTANTDVSDELNKIIVIFGVDGGECCYYWTYQLGSNTIPALENKDGETNANTYSIFAITPVITMKFNGEYVIDMKNSNPNRYNDTKAICKKLGISMFDLHNSITGKNNDPADQQEADETFDHTKDTYLEFGLNVNRRNKSNIKALYKTFELIKQYTTTNSTINNNGYQQNTYLFNIKHLNQQTSGSRYNKSIEIKNIKKETFAGIAYTHKYSMRIYAMQVDEPLDELGNNGVSDDNSQNYPKGNFVKAVMRLVYQDTTEYTIIDVDTISISSVIEDSGNKKGYTYNLLDAMTFQDVSGIDFSFPLLMETLNRCNFTDRYLLYDSSMQLLNFASTTQHLNWYERGWFVNFVQVVLVIVAVVVTVVTLGAGTSLSAALITIAETIAISYGLSYALKWALEQTNNDFLRGLIVVVYIALTIETGKITSDKDLYMLLASSALNATDAVIEDMAIEEQESMRDFLTLLNQRTRELEAKQDELGGSKEMLDFNLFIESPEAYYNRVLNTDIVEYVEDISLDFMSNDLDKFLDIDNLYIKE